MAILRIFLLACVCLPATPALGHHMGRPVPIGYAGEGTSGLQVHVLASYFEEQMGRETRFVETDSPDQCMRSILNREFPMAVLPADTTGDLPEGIIRSRGFFGPPGREFVLIMGSEASNKLEFSLVPIYLEKLSEIDPSHWAWAIERVEAGEGIRGVALKMLRKADLI